MHFERCSLIDFVTTAWPECIRLRGRLVVSAPCTGRLAGMAGDTNGTEEALAAQDAQAANDTREKQAKVSGDGHGAAGNADYECAIGERNARIAELEAQAAKSAQAAGELRAQIAELKAQGENYRIDFRLRLAGARNLKVARAVLTDHDSDVEALVAAESWLFSQTGALLKRLLRTFLARRAWSPLASRAARPSAT